MGPAVDRPLSLFLSVVGLILVIFLGDSGQVVIWRPSGPKMPTEDVVSIEWLIFEIFHLVYDNIYVIICIYNIIRLVYNAMNPQMYAEIKDVLLRLVFKLMLSKPRFYWLRVSKSF